MLVGKGYEDRLLNEAEIRALMAEALDASALDGERVLCRRCSGYFMNCSRRAPPRWIT